MTTAITTEQKAQFVRDGFIVLRDVVTRDLTSRARREIHMHTASTGTTRPYHALDNDALPDLMNKSPLADIMRDMIGPYDAPSRAFAATLYPQPQPQKEVPNFGWQPHVDGWWYGQVPETPEEVDSFQIPRTSHFGAADATEIGANHTPFFQDPACTLSTGSFTAFVGVALNDQSEFGRGNLCLLKGAQEVVESFYQMQRDAGGVIGPEGEGWPRLSPTPDGNGVTLTNLPTYIRDHFLDTAETTPDGTIWLAPTPVLLEEGDVVIAMHACPHNGSMNLGPDPRMIVYFRLRHKRPGASHVYGDSDHPDRGWEGEFLDYPDDFNPWSTAIDSLCDHWRDWDGLQDQVEAMRGSS
ncbi:MAG: hypothetical protein AAF525_06375 [Pseudomonadota bacterium]